MQSNRFTKKEKVIYFFVGLLAIAIIGSLVNTKPAEKSTVLLDIKTIAGAAPAEVEKVLGKSEKLAPIKDSRSGCKACPKSSYKDGAIEVVYIDGKADWITLNLKGGKWDDHAIELLGLPPTSPSVKAPGAIRWNDNVPGFREIAVFPGQADTIEYFYVKTATE